MRRAGNILTHYPTNLPPTPTHPPLSPSPPSIVVDFDQRITTSPLQSAANSDRFKSVSGKSTFVCNFERKPKPEKRFRS